MYRDDYGAALARIAQLLSELRLAKRLLAEATASHDECASVTEAYNGDNNYDTEVSLDSRMTEPRHPFKPMKHRFPIQKPLPEELLPRSGRIDAVVKADRNADDLPSASVVIDLRALDIEAI